MKNFKEYLSESIYKEETYEGDDFFEAYGVLWFNEDDVVDEAEYQGRKVKLGKPMRGDVKKFKVYVKDARHNCDNPGPRTKARYWSCRKW